MTELSTNSCLIKLIRLKFWECKSTEFALSFIIQNLQA